MSDKVREWTSKAEGDFATAARELRAPSQPNYDAVCFHAQQCIEKLLKGGLQSFGIEPPRVHDLAYLSNLLRDAGIAWNADERDLRFLSQSAVVFRYPGESATADDAKEAMEICKRLRDGLLAVLRGAKE